MNVRILVGMTKRAKKAYLGLQRHRLSLVLNSSCCCFSYAADCLDFDFWYKSRLVDGQTL